MKRLYKNWLVRITIGFAALTSLRLVSTLLHMTTLEKLYKPRDFRRTSHQTISREVIDTLPKYCTTMFGQAVDPINIILIGTESGIRHSFEKASWYGAHPTTPLHLAAGFLSATFNRSYKSGPFTPFFTGIGTQDMSFQKLTQLNSFRQRHHVRIWRTKHTLPGGKRMWIAAASFDVSMRVNAMPPFVHHHIDPDLDAERDYIVAELLKVGNLLGESHRINPEILPTDKRRNAFGARYYTDGMAKVIEIV